MSGPPSGTWVSCPRPDPSAPWRLWCLPHAGGSTSAWAPWSAGLAGTAEVAALRPPGRESRLREKPATEWQPLVAGLLAAMEPHLGRRYALAGHSLGGILAFELARAARARGLPEPEALIVTGARAPGSPRREPEIAGLPDREFLAEFGGRYQGIPPAVLAEPELVALLLPVMRADMAIFEGYRHEPGPPLRTRLLALGGEDDPHVTREELLGWRQHTAEAFEGELLPGGHFFLQQGGTAMRRVARFLNGS